MEFRLVLFRSSGENSALDITDFPFVTDYWNSRNGFVAVLPQAACPGLFQRHHAPVFFGIPMRDSAHQAVAANHGAGQRNLEGFTRSQGKIYILERERRSEADIIVGPIDDEARIIIIGGAGNKANRENVPQDFSNGPGLLNTDEGFAHSSDRTG